MTEAGAVQPRWDHLVGEDLSAVVFVRDYLQLQFDGPGLSAFSARVTVFVDGTTAAFGEPPFANVILSLIGQTVQDVQCEHEQEFRIIFTSGSRIVVSLRPEHYVGPEVLEFHDRDDRTVVI
jgi:hypothetical protein